MPREFLMGSQEIAARLGTSRQRTYQLTRRTDFPKSYATLAQGKILSRPGSSGERTN